MITADWRAIAAELDASGCARTPRLLTPAACRDLAALYDKPELFRSTVDMARHRFGSGQYRSFTHDFPPSGTVSASCVPAAGTPSASSSTTPSRGPARRRPGGRLAPSPASCRPR